MSHPGGGSWQRGPGDRGRAVGCPGGGPRWREDDRRRHQARPRGPCFRRAGRAGGQGVPPEAGLRGGGPAQLPGRAEGQGYEDPPRGGERVLPQPPGLPVRRAQVRHRLPCQAAQRRAAGAHPRRDARRQGAGHAADAPARGRAPGLRRGAVRALPERPGRRAAGPHRQVRWSVWRRCGGQALLRNLRRTRSPVPAGRTGPNRFHLPRRVLADRAGVRLLQRLVGRRGPRGAPERHGAAGFALRARGRVRAAGQEADLQAPRTLAAVCRAGLRGAAEGAPAVGAARVPPLLRAARADPRGRPGYPAAVHGAGLPDDSGPRGPRAGVHQHQPPRLHR
mmetsp:Transcript_97119/g.253022  ORF Transcript_97119/g.253022 Transcript_97119/m.253022 type:complete len:336 (+) Transcript_97119:379-1386(+)